MRRSPSTASLLLLFLLGNAARAGWVPQPGAPQRVYLAGVPHTDRTGKLLAKFDAERSFLPIALYHALHGDYGGRRYRLADYAKASFNAAHLWEGSDLTGAGTAARDAGVQLIVHNPPDAFVAAHRDDPAFLAWYLDEEPTGRHWGEKMNEHFRAFVANRERLREIDPGRPVFALDVPWITAPATEWWVRWNTAGDVSAHDILAGAAMG